MVPPARLYARHFVGTITTERLLVTLSYFRRKAGCPLLLVWDRLNAHVAGRTQAWLAARATDYAHVFLSGYAPPELNPEEQCNRHAKHALLNALPSDVAALLTQARREFRRLGRRPDLLASFFAHAGLRVTKHPRSTLEGERPADTRRLRALAVTPLGVARRSARASTP